MDPLTSLSKLSVLKTVIQRCWRHVVEATVIPALLFYVCLVTAGLGWAYLAAIGWAFGTAARRLVRRRPIPPILVLGIVGITAKTVVAVLSGSAFIYFFQPVLANVAMCAVFLLSVAVGRPLIGRLADEFWEVTPAQRAHPAIRGLFRRLTLLWAAVNLAIATTTLAMLLWLPLATFVAMKQVSALALTFGATLLTIALSLRTARHAGLVGATAEVTAIPVSGTG
jgi:hypothetical protein